jgi:DNA-binding response OmpR family regulator
VGTERGRVLVVDDESAILEALEDVLTSEGFEVATATNGLDGLERARACHPHLVLLDVMMPFLDGREMLRRLRADPTLVGTPVVLMSAGSVSAEDEQLAGGFLPKPFGLDELFLLVDQRLAREAEQA